jgi:hypothetical protein
MAARVAMVQSLLLTEVPLLTLVGVVVVWVRTAHPVLEVWAAVATGHQRLQVELVATELLIVVAAVAVAA